MLKKFIGDKAFYRRLFVLMIPIMVQNGITNFVSMLDNIMIGRLGTPEMTGVAVVNQLMFVFNLCIFGAVSGAGIFGAQFFGRGDTDGVRHSFRFKYIFSTVMTVLAVLLFATCGEWLIGLYLKGEGSAQDIAATMVFAKKYMTVMAIGMLPYALSQCYASTLRETNQASVPMCAGIVAVIVNLMFNYVLIFGALGFPALGVAGAAIATVIARFAELAVVAIWSWRNRYENSFIIGAFKSLCIPKELVWRITVKGMPLMINESLWAAGMALLSQCYSMRGFEVVAANNIAQTFYNLFSIVFVSTGGAIGIILGQMLGNGELEEAKAESIRLIAFSVISSVIIGALYAFLGIFIPHLYNVDGSVKILATRLMQITAAAMPFFAFTHSCYFTLRSGGKIAITFVFDCCFVWAINLPVVYLVTKYTDVNILAVFAISESVHILKCVLGGWFVAKGVWIRNLVASDG